MERSREVFPGELLLSEDSRPLPGDYQGSRRAAPRAPEGAGGHPRRSAPARGRRHARRRSEGEPLARIGFSRILSRLQRPNLPVEPARAAAGGVAGAPKRAHRPRPLRGVRRTSFDVSSPRLPLLRAERSRVSVRPRRRTEAPRRRRVDVGGGRRARLAGRRENSGPAASFADGLRRAHHGGTRRTRSGRALRDRHPGTGGTHGLRNHALPAGRAELPDVRPRVADDARPRFSLRLLLIEDGYSGRVQHPRHLRSRTGRSAGPSPFRSRRHDRARRGFGGPEEACRTRSCRSDLQPLHDLRRAPRLEGDAGHRQGHRGQPVEPARHGAGRGADAPALPCPGRGAEGAESLHIQLRLRLAGARARLRLAHRRRSVHAGDHSMAGEIVDRGDESR